MLPETSNIVALKYSKAPSLMVDDYGDSGDCDFAELVKEKSNVVARFVHPDSKQTFVVQVAHGVAVGKKQPSLTVVHIYGAWDKIPASVLALVKKMWVRAGLLLKLWVEPLRELWGCACLHSPLKNSVVRCRQIRAN